MARDTTIPVARGMLTIAKANAALTALVPAASIFRQATPANPTFPFIRSGAPSVVPRRAVCVDGGDWTVAMHGFSTGRREAGQLVETAEDHAGRIGEALAAALDRQVIALTGGRATIRWTGSQLLMDPDEADCFHVVVNFRVHVVTG